MHTVIVIGSGLLLLGLFLLAGRLLGGQTAMANAALYFIGAWLLASAFNMYVGVTRAGYSVTDELPMFLIVFGIPTAVALLLRWRL